MNRQSLKSKSPGTLVPAQFMEQVADSSGVIKSVARDGLAFFPDPLPPKKLDRTKFVGQLAEELLAAQSALVRLDESVATLPNPQILHSAIRRREVEASSVIENTIASGEEMALFEAGVADQRGQARQVVNNVRALQYGVSSPLPICENLIKQMHEVLMDGALTDGGRSPLPGRYRDSQVYIGDRSAGFLKARFVPPPPGEAVKECMREFERFANPGTIQTGNRDRYPELIELAFSHYQFETIHPFVDGNGRMGRALVNIAPLKSGLTKYVTASVSEYIERSRETYYNGLLRVSTHGDWFEWTRYFLTAIAQQAATDAWRVRRLLEMRTSIRSSFATTKRSSVKVLELIDRFFASPSTTVKQAAEDLSMTIPAAQKHIDRLVKQGFLREMTGRSKGRVYLAIKVIQIVHQPVPIDEINR